MLPCRILSECSRHGVDERFAKSRRGAIDQKNATHVECEWRVDTTERNVVAGDGTGGEFVDNGKSGASADQCRGDVEGSDRYPVLELDFMSSQCVGEEIANRPAVSDGNQIFRLDRGEENPLPPPRKCCL